uniref:DUF898 family protein n=1 Tax=Thaumasiovibrio occultus TaxID=1891184 RepID=UPI00131CAC69
YNTYLMLGVLAVTWLFLPFLYWAGLRFNARMSSYRNVRFDFTAPLISMFKIILFYPLLTIATLGGVLAGAWYVNMAFAEFFAAIYIFLVPYLFIKWKVMLDNHIYDHYSYGECEFETILSKKEYFFAYANATGLYIGMFVGLIVSIVLLGFIFHDSTFIRQLMIDFDRYNNGFRTHVPFAVYIMVFLSYLVTGLMGWAWKSTIFYRIRNHIYENISVYIPGGKTLQVTSILEFKPFVGLVLSNILMLFFSFGLAWPATRVRLAEHFTENTLIEGELDVAIASNADLQDVNVFGEEADDFFGMNDDFGI